MLEITADTNPRMRFLMYDLQRLPTHVVRTIISGSRHVPHLGPLKNLVKIHVDRYAVDRGVFPSRKLPRKACVRGSHPLSGQGTQIKISLLSRTLILYIFLPYYQSSPLRGEIHFIGLTVTFPGENPSPIDTAVRFMCMPR